MSDGFGSCRWVLTMTLLLGAIAVTALCAAPAGALDTHVLSSSFGASGSGAGQLAEGGGEGQHIDGVAVDSSTHDIYVADTGNHRVDEFSASGTFIRAWGWGVADGLPMLETCTLTCQAGLAGTGAGQFTTPTFVAVDNSAGPSGDDVYVGDSSENAVLKFTATGVLLSGWGTGGKLDGSTATDGPFGELAGIAVDGAGRLLVIGESSEVFQFAQNGTFVEDFTAERGTSAGGLAVNAEGSFFKVNGSPSVEESTHANVDIGQVTLGEASRDLAIDAATGGLYVDQGGEVEHLAFSAPGIVSEPGGGTCTVEPNVGCAPTDTFGAGELSAGSGIGVDPSTHDVFVADTAAGAIRVFTPAILPEAVTGATTNPSTGAVTLNGSVNPAGLQVTSCEFEYGHTTAYGSTVACSPNPGAGSSNVAVSARLTELGGLYHYRLVAANANGVTRGVDGAIQIGPSVEGESTGEVRATEATLGASLNSGEVSTSYHFEYGTSTAYGSSTAQTGIGAAAGTVNVQARISRLQPATVYHARVVATNALGSALGEDLTFTTSAAVGASASVLPDERAYELVSTANKGDVYEPDDLISGITALDTERSSRAAADGNKIAYVAEAPAEGGNGAQGYGLGNSWLASRTPQGWEDIDLMPNGASLNAQYVGFSSDLSVGIMRDLEPPASAPCDSLVSRTSDGVLHPFFTEQLPVACGSGNNNEVSFDAASADYSHLLFETQAPLISGAERSNVERAYNLYDSVNGQLQLVNVLPASEPHPAPNATFGGPHGAVGGENNSAGFTHAISADGSRIFWTNLDTGRLYLREDATRTVPVSAGAAEFWTATPDGSYGYYTEAGELWRFAVDRFAASAKPEAEALAEAREELTGPGADVLGVIGVNETGEDGAYLYFVAEGVLAGNVNASGASAREGAPNLYARVAGQTRFIATLLSADNDFGGPHEDQSVRYGDWQHNLGARTSQPTPDGHSIGFMSSASLTGYDSQGQSEVYIYDADTGALDCASCNPSGAPPQSGAREPISESSFSGGNTSMVRWLTEDGSRVFFETKNPVVPQDTNGRWNVYEWERAGAGGCHGSAGCVYLLSGGGGRDDAFLVDASADGSDVFFTSRENFTLGGSGEAVKLYDARVNGGFPETATACTGTGCQGVPPAPPVFATPSSATFNGVGNFAAPAKPKATTRKKTTAQLKAEKLAKALKACRKKAKRKRARCEQQASKKYAPAKKKGKR